MQAVDCRRARRRAAVLFAGVAELHDYLMANPRPVAHYGAKRSAALSNVAIFLTLHFPIGVLFYQNSSLATLHALSTLGLGFYFALVANRQDMVIATVAYIAGSEVLWRMTDAAIFWETGKYSLCLLLAIMFIRNKGSHTRGFFTAPIAFILLLTPGVLMTLYDYDFSIARRAVSFNLSGPLSVAIGALAMSQVRLSQRQIQRVILAAVGPLLSIASITLFTTYTSDDIKWTGSSNFITSGGYGPNQVSSALSVGALLLFYLMILNKQRTLFRVFLFALMVLCGVQSVMTFSRTGIYLVLGSISAVLLLFMFQGKRSTIRNPYLLAAAFIGALMMAGVNLNEFTEGALQKRYQDTTSTHRYEIALSDLELFRRNPIFGVGVGQAPFERNFFSYTASHTELTRMLAEHGLFGLAAVLILLWILFQNYRKKIKPADKALALGVSVWIVLFLLVSGMRLAMPGFLFGLITLALAGRTVRLRPAASPPPPESPRDHGPGDA